jgi:hypothetical protein
VPKAAMYEDGAGLRRNTNVRAAGKRALMKTVANTDIAQYCPDGQLGRGMLLTNATHKGFAPNDLER